MLQLDDHRFFHTGYRDLLDCLLSKGDFSPHGKRVRHFENGQAGGVMREGFISKRCCVRHTTCLVTTVSVWMGDNYPNQLKIPYTDADGHVWHHHDGRPHFGMAITLDQERAGECKASLWLETDPLEWLRPRMAPTIVDLEGQQRPAGKMPDWMSPAPGNLAIEYAKTVWRDIIEEWEAQDRSMAFERSTVPSEAQAMNYLGGAVRLSDVSEIRPIIYQGGTIMFDKSHYEMDSAMPQALRSVEKKHPGMNWKRDEISPGCVVYHLTDSEHRTLGSMWLRPHRDGSTVFFDRELATTKDIPEAEYGDLAEATIEHFYLHGMPLDSEREESTPSGDTRQVKDEPPKKRVPQVATESEIDLIRGILEEYPNMKDSKVATEAKKRNKDEGLRLDLANFTPDSVSYIRRFHLGITRAKGRPRLAEPN